MASHVVVGRYRLEELVQPRSDPSTWDATDLSTGERVRACLVATEVGSAARSRRSIDHPGLVRVRDVARVHDGIAPPLEGEFRGDLVVVLEHAPGSTLAERAAEGPVPLDEVLGVILSVGEALVALEQHGTVHGTVVPAAIVVGGGGPARLGLVGASDSLLAFASPARVCGGGPSTHDDAWSLLACAYLAVTGVPPFEAESPAALSRRILGGRPMPIAATTPAAGALQALFDRGFSRTASHRYVTVGALLDDLRGVLARAEAPGQLRELSPVRPRATATTARRPVVLEPRDGEPPEGARERPTVGAIPSARPSAPIEDDRLSPELPRLGIASASGRAMTLQLGSASSAQDGSPSPSSSHEVPDGGELASGARGSVDRSLVEPPTPSIPASRPSPPAEAAEATRRFDRDQIEQVWRENARRISSRPPALEGQGRSGPGVPEHGGGEGDRSGGREGGEGRAPGEGGRGGHEGPAHDALEGCEGRAPGEGGRGGHEGPAHDALESGEGRAPGEGARGGHEVPAHDALEGGEGRAPGDASSRHWGSTPTFSQPSYHPAPRPPPRAPTPAVASSSRGAAIGWIGLVLAGVASVAVWMAASSRQAPPAASAASPGASTSTIAPSASVVAPSAPPPMPSAAPSAPDPPPSSSAVDSTTPSACVRAHYEEGSFDVSADLSFVCGDAPLLRQRNDLQRAVVAGSRGRGVTPAMHEYALYHWFELPAVALLRAACCPHPSAPVAPRISGACSSPSETIWGLALTAASKDADLDPSLGQYRRMVTCVLGSGEAGLFGLTDAMTGSEEATFRALVQRSRARPR